MKHIAPTGQPWLPVLAPEASAAANEINDWILGEDL